QGIVEGDVTKVGGRPAPEGPTTGGEHDARDPAGAVPEPSAGGQALVDGAVLGVDGHDLGSRRCPDPLYDRATGDQRLLVGQGQAGTRLQGGEGDGQAGEADDAVDDHVGIAGDGGQGL